MLTSPPKLTYCGLTIVMSNPSRFDTKELLSANAGSWFKHECLTPEVNHLQCDIKLLGGSLLPGTKVILALGEKAMQSLTGTGATLGEQRGSPLWHGDIPVIATYSPQDAFDVQNYEKEFNPHLALADAEDEEGSEDKNLYEGKGRHGRTSRANWRFWLHRDTKKALAILKEGVKEVPVPKMEFYPSSQLIIDVLRSHKNEDLYLDIETDWERRLNCVGFCFSTGPIYVVPVYRYNNVLAYGNMPNILAALGVSMGQNTCVAHNGAEFDWPVLAMQGVPVGDSAYDTLIAQARIYPKVEKSLGHCVSLWTHQRYHKDDGILNPLNASQEESLWAYNARDVHSLLLIKKAQLEFAAKHDGMLESIAQANECIKPYITCMLQGIKYDPELVKKVMAENDFFMNQYLRWLEYLVGHPFLPTSPKQCVSYFHSELGYPPVKRSPKGAPSLDEKAIQKLKLKHGDNPVLDLTLRYRQLAKETGSLKFTPLEWKAPFYETST